MLIVTLIFYILYLILFTVIIRRWKFFSNSGLEKGFLQIVFYVITIAGLSNYFIYSNVFGYNDAQFYLESGGVVYNSLFDNPLYFFELLLGPNGYSDVPPAHLKKYIEPIFWYTGREYSIVRVNTVLYFFSQGNFFIHLQIIAFSILTALVMLFRVFSTVIPRKKSLLVLSLFFTPTLFYFWISAGTKDSFIFFLSDIFL